MKDTYKTNSEIPVGSILFQSFGYSMIIPKFFRVIKHEGSKTLVCQELEKETVSGDSWQGQCVPGNVLKEKIVRARISKWGFLKLDGDYANIWDGKPKMYDYLD